jgi:hypothetical protein
MINLMKEDVVITKRIVAVGVLLLLILLGCSVDNVQVDEPNYLPLAEGNTWIYDVEDEETSLSYILVCEMIEIEPGTFGWNTYIEAEQSSLLAAEGPESGEPFGDSTISIDSLLNIPGWGVVVSLEPVEFTGQSRYTIKTLAGTFEDCIFVESKENIAGTGTRFDAWFAPEIGPIYIAQCSEGTLLKRFSLLSFTPAPAIGN